MPNPPPENLVKARARKVEQNRQVYLERDLPLIERLRRLETELGERSTLTDLVYAAIEEGHEQGLLEHHFPSRSAAAHSITKLLNGRLVTAMYDPTYASYLYAIEQLEEPLQISSDMRTLKEAIEENGFYKIVPDRKGHLKLLTGANHPAGEDKVVVDEGGPITLPGTPSDVRWRKNAVARLRRASMRHIPVLSSDPFGNQSRALLPEYEEKRTKMVLAGQRTRQQKNAERTRELRTLMEPLFAKLGSWENSGFMTELSRVILHYGRARKIERWFNSRPGKEADRPYEAVAYVLRRLNRGETLNEHSINAMSLFWHELDLAPDPVQRYIELLRESRGLVEVEALTEEEALEAPAPLRKAVVELAESYAQPVASVPSTGFPLALEVLYEMVAGRADADRERVLEIALRVMRLENGR